MVGCGRRSRSSAASLRVRTSSTVSASATNRNTPLTSGSLSSAAFAMVSSSDIRPR